MERNKKKNNVVNVYDGILCFAVAMTYVHTITVNRLRAPVVECRRSFFFVFANMGCVEGECKIGTRIKHKEIFRITFLFLYSEIILFYRHIRVYIYMVFIAIE